MHSHQVFPHKPGELCAVGLYLLYKDLSKYEFYWLDLSDGQPKPAAGKPVTHTRNDDNEEMCFVQYGEKCLLVVAGGDEGLFAYNTDTDKLEWKVEGELPGMKYRFSAFGVTTDRCGHLYVAEGSYGNRCIQMFSASDGRYLGRLMKGVERIGDPIRVYSSAETSSLLAACYLQNKFYLQFINIQYSK